MWGPQIRRGSGYGLWLVILKVGLTKLRLTSGGEGGMRVAMSYFIKSLDFCLFTFELPRCSQHKAGKALKWQLAWQPCSKTIPVFSSPCNLFKCKSTGLMELH